MPLSPSPSPMFAAVGADPAVRAGIRGAIAKGNYASKDGVLHDKTDDEGGPGTVKECPECGETYTGEIDSHTHKATMRKGIRGMLAKAAHCAKCVGDKTLMKCETCGCHKGDDAHTEATVSGERNVGIRKALRPPLGIRDFLKSVAACAHCAKPLTTGRCGTESCPLYGRGPNDALPKAYGSTNVAAVSQVKDARANRMGHL